MYKMAKVRILAIDGGGVRGIIPVTILAELESRLQIRAGDPGIRLSDYFDVIAGTSTGGILTCLYLLPDEKGNQKFSAAEIAALFWNNVKAIFPERSWISEQLEVLDKGPIYSNTPLKEIGEKYAADIKLSQLRKVAFLTAYSVDNSTITTSSPHYFCSLPPQSSLDGLPAVTGAPPTSTGEHPDFYVRDLILATSAAPTYFPPVEIQSTLGKLYHMIDGGVYANNPAESALVEIMSQTKYKNLKDYLIVSISCGDGPLGYSYDQLKSAGTIGWLRPLINILIDGCSQNTDKHLRHLYRDLPGHYIRFDTPLVHGNTSLDDASDKNLSGLKTDALNYLASAKASTLLNQVVDSLVKIDEGSW